jgi:hypothetical protein
MRSSKVIAFCAFLLTGCTSSEVGQQQNDLFYLKNGRITEGTFYKRDSLEYLYFTTYGAVKSLKISEVDSIVRVNKWQKNTTK